MSTRTDITAFAARTSPSTIPPAAATHDNAPDASSGLVADFRLSEVAFGASGYVAITNVGGADGSIAGYAVCQRAECLVLDPITVEPFGVVWVAANDGEGLSIGGDVAVLAARGGFGSLLASDGEIALFRSEQFSSADELVTYVEWGSADNSTEAIAVEAGLWETGAFIEIPPDAFGVVSTRTDADSSRDWVALIGG